MLGNRVEPAVKSDDTSDVVVLDHISPSGIRVREGLAETGADGPLVVGYPVITFTQAAYYAALKELNRHVPEAAGILVGPKDCELVTHFLFDHKGKPAATSFVLNAESLNGAMKPFLACNMEVKGFMHSHPPGFNIPSTGDLQYLKRTLGKPSNRDAYQLFFPIICNKQVYAYVVRLMDDGLHVAAAQVLLV